MENEELRLSKEVSVYPSPMQFRFGLIILIANIFGVFAILPMTFASLITKDPGLTDIIMNIGSLLITIVLYIILFRDKIKIFLKSFNLDYLIKGLAYALLMYIVALIVSFIVTLLIGDPGSNDNQDTLNNMFANFPLYSAIFMVILAPICEEIGFRYIVYKGIEKKNKWLAFVVSVILFASVHFISSFITAASLNNMSLLLEDLKSLPMYILPSIVLVYSYMKEKSLFVPIFAHMVYNGIQVALMLIMLSANV